jgi:hypothetical protein
MKHTGALCPNLPAGGNSTQGRRTNGGVTTRLLMIGFGTLSLTLTAGWYLVLFQVVRWAIGRGHP